jgi:hypothetical protein
LRELYPGNGRFIGKLGAGVWSRGDVVRLSLDGTSATALELIPEEAVNQPVLFNAALLDGRTPPAVEMRGSALLIAHVAGEPGTIQKFGVLLAENREVSSMTINGTAVTFTQFGSYVEAQLQFAGARFAQAQEVAIAPGDDGGLSGTFAVPQRVLDQLADRKLKWPIPWTEEDYETTWLAPERLLLFAQAAAGWQAAHIQISL